MDAARIRAACAEAPPDRARLALLWSCHLQDLWAAFGMEDALVAMVERPAVAQAVLARILDFYLKANRLVYEAAGRFLDAVLIGNDIGCQTGLMLAPELVRRYMLPGTKALIEQAHSYGIKVLHHSCGSIRPLIPDLVSAGADALHPIQALAAGMAAEELAGEFRDRVSFVGGLDVQELMVHGAPEAVERRVRELAALFPTGLVISPSHEALLPDVPPENVEAFRRAMRRLGPDR
jgi:uroporphyrinogen decarboxylase